jgi:bifunctional DNA-binding transcriptional regulator/antitoxin component of YhaV-PrlF toxin-antitoxin module
MKQFSIKGIEALLSEDVYYTSIIKQDNKALFLDKCNWLISKILKVQLQYEKGLNELVNVHSDALKKYLGDRYYKSIISSLVAIKIISVNKTYSSGRFSYSYSIAYFSDKEDIVLVPVKTKRFRNKLINQSSENFKAISDNHLLKKINNNTAKLYLTNSRKNYLIDFKDDLKWDKNQPEDEYILVWYEDNVQLRLNKYDAYFDAFRELNKSIDAIDVCNLTVYFNPSVNKLGRVYHIGATVPRLIREGFKTKSGEDIWEVDMASAQPSILILEWLKYLNLKNQLTEKEKSEAVLCLKLVLGGEVYKHIKDNSSYLANMDYAKMKKNILTSLNSKINSSELSKHLKMIFPFFLSWVNSIKTSRGHEAISHLGQSSEANIFVEVYKGLPDDIFSLIVHDCILTTKENTDTVKTLLMNRVKALYKRVLKEEANLDKLFKVDIVSKAMPDY